MRSPFDNDERRAFRETIRRFVDEEIRPHADAWDEAGSFPRELHRRIGDLGAFGFGIDTRYGGLGFDDCFMRAAYAEEMGRCGANGITASLGARSISMGPIQRLAAPELCERVLPPIVAGEENACLAITEPSGGSDVAGLRARARREGTGYRLNGTKTFITGGMHARWFVVAARTGGPGLGGISLFLVEADRAGVRRTPLDRKTGWWCSDTATLYFEDCLVPASQRLGEEHRGFLAVMENFNLERVALIAQALGMMKVCFEDAVAWARERETFGRRLIEHQVIRHKLAEISARIDAVESTLERVCWSVNEGDMPVAGISKLKFLASRALEFCASEAVQILGGAGYLRGNRIERIYREVKVIAIGGGSEEIMRDLACRQMGL